MKTFVWNESRKEGSSFWQNTQLISLKSMIMKNKDEEVDFSEENFKKRFRQINRTERSNAVINKSAQESKNRITIYLDEETIELFQKSGER